MMGFREFFRRRKKDKGPQLTADLETSSLSTRRSRKKKKSKRRSRKDKKKTPVYDENDYTPPTEALFPQEGAQQEILPNTLPGPLPEATKQHDEAATTEEPPDSSKSLSSKQAKKKKRAPILPSEETAKAEEYDISTEVVKHGCSFDWKIRSQSGFYEGSALGGWVPHGLGILHFSNGAVYEGPFHNGKLHGNMASYTSSSGATYNGEFYRNLKQGYGEEIFKSGRRYVGNYEEGHPHGFGIQYFPSGRVLHAGDWKMGKPVQMPLTVKVMDDAPMSVEITLSNDMGPVEKSSAKEPTIARFALDGSESTKSAGSSSASSEEEEGTTSIYDDGSSMTSWNSGNSLFSKSSWRSSNFDTTEEIPVASDVVVEGITSGTYCVQMRPSRRKHRIEMPPVAVDMPKKSSNSK